MNKILIAGHRGSLSDYPENTMPSFQAAIACGVDMIETDIHMTGDGQLVLIHDSRVDRTTNGTALVKDMTLSDIKKLDAGSHKDIRFAGVEIPTLEEFLDSVKDNKELLFNFELKDYPEECGYSFCQESIDKTISLIRDFHLENRCVINSFSAYILEYVDREYRHSFKLHGFYPYTIMKGQKRNPSEYLYCACLFDEFPCPRQEWFSDLLSLGIEPWLGAKIQLKADFEKAIRYGGRLFTSNYPADALQILSDLGVR
ncbi:MAG TPA: hypothetical protein DD640_08065 [Clostridiales bacterium]|nr:hypothetical protein [Clostridiales bacterium]